MEINKEYTFDRQELIMINVAIKAYVSKLRDLATLPNLSSYSYDSIADAVESNLERLESLSLKIGAAVDKASAEWEELKSLRDKGGVVKI